MSSVWGMILQWGSTIKVSIELPVATRHRRDMIEELLKATLNQNKQQKLRIIMVITDICVLYFMILLLLTFSCSMWSELPHDKSNKMTVRPVKTQVSLKICPVWSESLLSAWRNIGSSATHWVPSEDWSVSESSLVAQTILLVLSWWGSFLK